MNKKSFLFKISISILLIVYLIFWISWERLAAIIKSTNYTALLLIIPFILILYIIRAIKWGIILKTTGTKIKISERFKIILIGLFYGLFTPAKAGELARVYFLKQKKSTTIPTVIWDKFLDALALLTLSIAVALLFFRDIRIFIIIIVMAALILITLFFLTNKRLTFIVAKIFKISEDYRKDYFRSMEAIGKNKEAVIKAYLLGILYYFVTFIIGSIVLKALNKNLNNLLIFSIPLITLFGNAPVVISGLGLREFIAAFTFKMLGAETSYGFSFSLLLFIVITLIPGIIGYILNLTTGKIVKLENIPGNYYDKHHSKNIIVQMMMNKFHNDFIKFIKKANAKTLLDVGCGEGYTTKIIKKKNGSLNIEAIDTDKGIIRKAKSLHTGIKFSTQNVYNLKFKNNSFDGVMASELLEHLTKPEKGIKEIKRVSKKYCIFSVPKEPYWRIANMLRGAYITRLGNTPGHVQNWTTHQFKNLLKKHFRKVTIKSSTLWNIALCEK